MLNKQRLVLIIFIVLGCIACDQVSKYAAQQILEERHYSFLGDTVRLGISENTGAFLGLGSELDESTRHWLFVVLTGLFLAGLLAYVLIKQEVKGVELISWCLLLGGGLGNFIDRAWREGHVVDFMNLGIGSLRTGIFNVADMAIMAGGLILVYISLRRPKSEP